MSTVSNIRTGITAIENAIPQNLPSHIHVQTSVFSGRSSCSQACRCRCHRFTRYASPQSLEPLVGKLLIGYCGIPSHFSCNENRCQQSKSSLLTVSYYFPPWFLGRCMIFFRDRWSPTDGHAISVRTPRTLQPGNESVIISACRGDVAAIQTQFVQGLASPFDVNFHGESLLSVTTIYFTLKIIYS